MFVKTSKVSAETSLRFKLNRLNLRTVGTFLVPIVAMIFILKFFFPILARLEVPYKELAEMIGIFKWGFFDIQLGKITLIASAELFLLTTIFFILHKTEKKSPRDFGLVWSLGEGGWKKVLWFNAKVFFIFIFLFIVILNIAHYFFGKDTVHEMASRYMNLFQIKKMNFKFNLLAPPFEEIMFRGIYCTLLVRHGLRWRHAILITAVCFGLIHLLNQHFYVMASVIQVLYATVVGVFLGWIFYKTRSVIVPIAWHYLFNVIFAMMAFGPDNLARFSRYFIL